MFLRKFQPYQSEAEPESKGAGAGSDKKPDPRDAQLAAALKAKADADAAAKKNADDFEAYKAEQARTKMSEQEKLVADKTAAEKKAEKAEKEAAKAKKETEKAYFGAELVAQGLKSMKLVDVVMAERSENEDAKTLAARLKAQEEFSGLFGTASRSAPAKAPVVPGGRPSRDVPVADEDEDERAFKMAFPKEPAAVKAAKERLAVQRTKSNNEGNKKKKRA